ncbi:ribosome biogenesis GTP-binding protein YihA/YsxC, partial [Roseisolibacter sp. H3M3-2]|uniref:ribosome biogenesis GTP-binding protein YihA/YsxC n=1 Tax=Roseisolibacter sp. H3M3-2 TaxID=3031323 RepID=UPI0023DBB85C
APAGGGAPSRRQPRGGRHAPGGRVSADPMVIRRLEYLGPMASPHGWRPEAKLPEVAFSGRSNVGKSSLINKLVRRKGWARVSNTPGRTREIHFFDVNGTFALVDLPGYGYARISKERKAEWRPLIEGFLRASPQLRGVVQLLDVRHGPTEDDYQMLDFLGELGAPTLIAATKIDKLKKAEVGPRLKALAEAVGTDESQIIPFSAVTGEGRDELAAAIVELVGQPSWRAEEFEAPAAPEPDGEPETEPEA